VVAAHDAGVGGAVFLGGGGDIADLALTSGRRWLQAGQRGKAWYGDAAGDLERAVELR
jgi:hypothetical protein